MIEFHAQVQQAGETMLVVLPHDASAQLPSRGLVMIRGTLNGQGFTAPLEPDGRGSHWLNLLDTASTDIKVSDIAEISCESMDEWPEPIVPSDIETFLHRDKVCEQLWHSITPLARWDWLRWIRATPNPATRAKRIEVMGSKLKNGSRRPCCFNRTQCTDYSVAKAGILQATLV